MDKETVEQLRQAAFQFRATIRLIVKSPRERQLAVERLDEALLWAMQGVRRERTGDPLATLDEAPPTKQS